MHQSIIYLLLLLLLLFVVHREIFINLSRNEWFLPSSYSHYLFEQRENEKRTEAGQEYRKTDKKENLPVIPDITFQLYLIQLSF